MTSFQLILECLKCLDFLCGLAEYILNLIQSYASGLDQPYFSESS